MKIIVITALSALISIQPSYGMLSRVRTYFSGSRSASQLSRPGITQRIGRQTGQVLHQAPQPQSLLSRISTYARSFSSSHKPQFSSTPSLSFLSTIKSYLNPKGFEEDKQWLINFSEQYLNTRNRAWTQTTSSLVLDVKKRASAINAKNKYEVADIYGNKQTEEQTPLYHVCEEALGIDLIRGFDKNKTVAPIVPISIDTFMQNLSKPYDELAEIFVKSGASLSKGEQTHMLSQYYITNTVFDPIRFKQLIGISQHSIQTKQEKTFDLFTGDGSGLMGQAWKPLINIMQSVTSFDSVPLAEREELQKEAQPTIAAITKAMLENYLAKAEKSIQTNDTNFLMNEASARLLNFRQYLLDLDTGNKRTVERAGSITRNFSEGWSPAYDVLAKELAEAHTLLLTNKMSLEELSNVLSDNMNKVTSMRSKGESFPVKSAHAETIKTLYNTLYDITPTTLFNILKKRVNIIKERIVKNECGTEFDQEYYKKFVSTNPALYSISNAPSKPAIVERLEPK